MPTASSGTWAVGATGRKTCLNGPPLPAPPAFTALATAGLGALDLIEREGMSERYPGYDVLAKRHTPSWNEKTRQVIDERLAMPREPRYLSQAEWLVLEAICDRIVPQPRTRPPVPLAAMVDAKLFENRGDGYRDYPPAAAA